MKKIILFLLFFSFSGKVLASSAKSVVETQVEGDNVQVHQVVETTVDGQTVRKESTQPGKLELEMKKTGEEDEATVSFSQETVSPVSVTPIPKIDKPPAFFFVVQVTEFFRNFFSQCFALVRGLTSR